MKKFQSIDEYYAALDKAPPQEWIKSRDEKYPYLPIQVIDASLRYVFGEYQVENVQVHNIVNELVVTCEIVVEHPIIADRMLRFGGIAANPIIMSKGAKVADFTNSKITNALEYNAPGTLASAIVNAASKIGNFFGQNIGRKDTSPGFTFRIAPEAAPATDTTEKPNTTKTKEDNKNVK